MVKFTKYVSKHPALLGELYILTETFFWSLFPVIAKVSLAGLPLFYAGGISLMLASTFFGIVMTLTRSWPKKIHKKAWIAILLATFIIGVGYYILVFLGLKYTSAGNASMISQTEILFSLFILELWNKERLKSNQKTGAVLMFFGALIILFQGKLAINFGDLLILTASAIAAFGNFYSQTARKLVNSTFILFIRSIVSGFVFLLIALFFESFPQKLSSTTGISILINGILILGLSKILWLEAINLIPITKAKALQAFSPSLTLLFAFLLLGEKPSVYQIVGFIPIVGGVFLLSDLFSRKHDNAGT